jgi:predicted kinase
MHNIMATLILVCGMAGAGKSTLAKELEASRHALRLCPDEWIKAVIKVEADKAELDRLRSPVESLQWDLARKLLKLGMTVILENGFWSREERVALRTQAMELEADVELHYLNIPREELWKRLQKRNAEASNGSFIVTEHELGTWISSFTTPDSEEISGYRRFQEYRGGPVLP